MPKDWTDKIKNRASAASEFLKPFAAGNKSLMNPEEENAAKDSEPEAARVINVEGAANKGEQGQDFLDELLDTGRKKKDNLILTGVYLQPELAKILDSLGKKGGRGTKSRIVNEALRKVFKEKGLL